ncbi:MAG: DUF4280 domain-containing protein [Acidimicrobiia bacterium]
MGLSTCSGAALACSFGAVPSVLTVIPAGVSAVAAPAATILDFQPYLNIAPFGVCSSLANPTVAAATAAASGALTPMPCTPALVAPWAPGSPTVLVGGLPALTNSSVCQCAYAGVITITSPGQFTVTVP